MGKKKKLSIIIVSYNSKKNLEKCLKSIYEKIGSFCDWEVIVVNNDRREDLSKIKVDFGKIRIIEHKKNIGFGAGVNLGFKKTKGDFLFILNPDTEIFSDNIENVLQEFESDDKIGIIGAGIFNRKGQKQKWSAGKEISFYDLVRNNLGISRSKKIWESLEKGQCDWVSGTALFIKRELFQKLKGFDVDNFFMYFEDMDLCRRARKIDKKIIFHPHFKVCHNGGESYNNKRLQKRHYYNSMEKYFKKHSKLVSLWVARFIRKFILKK